MAYNSRTTYFGGASGYSALVHGIGEDIYNSRYQNCASDGSSPAGQFPLMPGVCAQLFGDRWFKYIEGTAAAFAEGNVLEPMAAVSYTSASSALNVITGTAGATVYENQFRGGWAYVTAGTGIGQCIQIVGNTANAATTGAIIYLEKTPGTDLASATVKCFMPHRMRKAIVSAGAAVMNRPISGVSLGTVTIPSSTGWWAGGITYAGWMQFRGFCPVVLVSTTITAPASSANAALFGPGSGGTAGVADPIPGTDPATADYWPFGIVPSELAAATTPGTAPAYLTNCTG